VTTSYKAFRGDGAIVDNLVVTTTQPPARRRLTDRVVTILLLIAHALLALYTLAAAAGIQMYEDDMESRCRSHDLDCSSPWVAVVANIGWIGTGLLFSLDLVFAIRLMRKGRLAFYVPLLGFLGQVALIVAMVVVNRWKAG
jgi:hypothetical protein